MPYHHKLIRSLIARIRELQEENRSLYDSVEHYSQVAQRHRREATELERRLVQEQRERDWREYEVDSLTRRLEEARRSGNEYEAEWLTKRIREVTRGW